MRHRKKGNQLNRSQSHRRMMLSNLVTSLILHEKVRTTAAKAREARPLAEKMITFAKRGDVHARRQVLRVVRDKDAVTKLFETLGQRFKDRPGGYTRIVKLGTRLGDNASMALFELVEDQTGGRSGSRRRRRRGGAKKAEAKQKQQKDAAREKEEKQPDEAAAQAAPEEQQEQAQTVAQEESGAGEESAAEASGAEEKDEGGDKGEKEEEK